MPLTRRNSWSSGHLPDQSFSYTAMTHCFINRAFIQQTFRCPRALIYLSLSQSMELDIALYNLSSGGGVITSHQLSLQPATANRKVSNVAAWEKIREENPENSKAIVGKMLISLKSIKRVCVVAKAKHFVSNKALFCTRIYSVKVAIFWMRVYQCVIVLDTWCWTEIKWIHMLSVQISSPQRITTPKAPTINSVTCCTASLRHHQTLCW